MWLACARYTDSADGQYAAKHEFLPALPIFRPSPNWRRHRRSEKACSGLRRERQWINEQHVQLCRIPAPTFLEGRRAEWMVAQLRCLGWDARIDRGGNVVAWPEGARGPFVALTAHLDTVLAPRVPEDIRVEPDGTLRGPGVSDNGAGLAAVLAIARLWKALPVRPERGCVAASGGQRGRRRRG